jgi:hypothetical protein
MVWSHGHTEDFEPLQAAEKQVKVLGMRSKERMTLFGGHFPWPGIGHVAKEERERERERERETDFDIFRRRPTGFPSNRVVHAMLQPVPTGV